MRVSNYAAFVGVALLAITPVQSGTDRPPPVPAAPQVTVGAGLRELIFDWDRVPGATWYELLANPDGRSGYTSINGRIPPTRTRAGVSVSVHLQHWATARYKVAACNAAGCRPSAPLAVDNQMLDTIGYVKASNTDAGDGFGYGVALSSDGYALAVSAAQESSDATGVNGNQADNSTPGSGAVYIYRREGRNWRQEAYLKSAISQPDQSFGYGYLFGHSALAINGDGSLLAVGSPGETVDARVRAGRVYLYGRSSSGTWTLRTTLLAPTPLTNDAFGHSVDMSVDGRTLKVNAFQPQDGEGNPEVRTFVYTRSGSTWTLAATIAPPVPGEFCQTVKLSGDGNTLIAHCWGYVGSPARFVTYKRNGNSWTPATDLVVNNGGSAVPLALNHSASRMAWTGSANLTAFVRTYVWGGNSWVPETTLYSPVPVIDASTFGTSLAFNRNGTLLAIGDIFASTAGNGVSGTATPGTQEEGAVFLFERGNGTTPWMLRSVVKPPNASPENLVGAWVALSGTGFTLAVGAPYEDSATRGVDGDRSDTSAPSAGAVYLY